MDPRRASAASFLLLAAVCAFAAIAAAAHGQVGYCSFFAVISVLCVWSLRRSWNRR
jgi:hypothetical protein